MEDVITVSANISTAAFEKGTKSMKSAIKSLSQTAQKMGNSIKKVIPTLIGVGSAYALISKAASTFLQQNERISNKMNSIWTAMGNLIGPIIEQIINWVSTAVSYFLSFLKLLGVTNKSASQLSKSAKGAASDLKKTVAGFDELNTLQDNSSSGGSGTGAAGLKDIEPSEWMKKLADLLKKGLWEDAGKMLAQRMNELVNSVDWAGLGTKIGYYLNGALSFIAAVIRNFDWHGLGRHLAVGFNHLISQINGSNLGTVLAAKFKIIIGVISGFLEDLDALKLAEVLSDTFTSFNNTITEALEEADWQKIGKNIADLIRNIKWDEVTEAAGKGLSTAFRAAMDVLSEVVLTFDVRSLGEHFAEIVNKILHTDDSSESIWENLGALLVTKFTLILDILGGFLETLDWPALSDALSKIVIGAFDALTESIENTDWQKIGANIATFISEIDWSGVFTALSEALGAAFGGINALILGLIQPAWEELTAWWSENAYEDGQFSIGKLLEGIGAGLVGIGEWLIANVWNPFSEAFWSTFDPDGTITATLVEWGNGVKEKIEEFKAKMEEAKQKIAESIEDMKTKFSAMKTRVTTVVDKVKGKIAEFQSKIDAIKQRHDEFKAKVDEVWDAAWEKISTVGTWILEKWQALKDGIESVRSYIDEKVTAIKQSWDDFWNGLGETIKGWANGAIGMINSVINAINSFSHLSYGGLSVNLPFGGGTIDVIPGFDLQLFNLQPIPYLAKGGILKKGQLGLLEGSGDEAVVPLEKNTDWINKVADELSARLRNSDFGFERIGGMLGSLLDMKDCLINYRIPAVAAGAILPYSITDWQRKSYESDENAELLNALHDVHSLLSEIKEDLNTMQFVAQFGDLRALARKITKEQRRDQISEGR